jgi:YbbR domain-containing protein
VRKLNAPIAVASLVLSVMLWVVVYSQSITPERPDRIVAPLKTEGLDTNRFVITQIDRNVRFTVVGPEDRLREYGPGTVEAIVDLSQATEGAGIYPVQIVPEEIQQYMRGGAPYTQITVERIARRWIPVRLEGVGELNDPGLQFVRASFQPSQVLVTGPQSVVAKAQFARVRLPLSEVNSKSAEPIPIDVEVVDASNTRLPDVNATPNSVNASVVTQPRPTERSVVVVPTINGQPAAGFQFESISVQPETITLTGEALAIAGLTKVETEPIDVNGLRATREYRVALRLPRGVRVAGPGNLVRVVYRVEPAANTQASPPMQSTPGGGAPQ